MYTSTYKDYFQALKINVNKEVEDADVGQDKTTNKRVPCSGLESRGNKP